jgi:hypothetical protein
VGIESKERSLAKAPPRKRRNAELDMAIAKTCLYHFESTANQMEFYLLRDGSETPASLRNMRAIAEQEIELAQRQFPLARDHSVIAYEASNHYYYTPLDLVEKTLNCRYGMKELELRMKTGASLAKIVV